MQQIAPNVFVETGYRNANVGCILTDDGAILVDTPMIPAQSIAWRAQVNKASGHAPLLYVINTDHHRGHALGNQHFLPAPVIAHERAWKEMRGYTENFKQRVRDSFKKEPEIQVQFNDLQIIRPQITFKKRLTLLRGGREVRLIWIGGHTLATSVVWMPAERVLFAGDSVWTDQHPYMAQANSRDWLHGLNYIRKLKPKIIVPGHGPTCGIESVDRVIDYIRYMRTQVRIMHRQGKSKQETGSLLVKDLVTWFPIPVGRKAKIESQIKQGIGRVFEEVRRSSEASA